jgi:peptidoglycan/xylan/chitin deacetylase (PgdA/CDA1 family)
MTRFHILILLAALCGAAAWASDRMGLLAGVAALFLVVTGLGVALPRLRLFGPYICKGNTSRRRAALTFDDGPDALSTPALLDLLREEGVKAAFFGVGRRVESGPELAARIVREGHLLENHSFGHSNATNFFGVGRLKAELSRAQEAIRRATGTSPAFFRPPMGLTNPLVFQAARALGLKVIGWSARGLDTRVTVPERIVERIVRRLEPGAIILLHDGNIPAGRLVVTVGLLLTKLREHGYEVVRLDQLLE